MKCLICYAPTGDQADYHAGCAKTLFDTVIPPAIDVQLADIAALARQIVRSSVSMTGVQKKLSAHIQKATDGSKRMTLVGLWGDYILKPPSNEYPYLPEIEDCTMKVAACLGIKTVPHGLIRLRSGELAYITKRIDRSKGAILSHMEDGCQLTGAMTEYKYRGSVEKLGKAIGKAVTHTVLDLTSYFELILVSFLTGNADMHLKNFSVMYRDSRYVCLAPAYDLVATRLVIPEKTDPEEMALTLNGKKRKLNSQDFRACGKTLGLSDKQVENGINRVTRNTDEAQEIIASSFLPNVLKDDFSEILMTRTDRLLRE
ncbi:MAG: HipA domain-containing protein [Planctomycetota bacterium]|jgi:serine/threonine-protein kinase HipA